MCYAMALTASSYGDYGFERNPKRKQPQVYVHESGRLRNTGQTPYRIGSNLNSIVKYGTISYFMDWCSEVQLTCIATAS